MNTLRRKFFRELVAVRGFLLLFLAILLIGAFFVSAGYFTIRNVRVDRTDTRLDLGSFSAAIRGITGANLFLFSTTGLEKKLRAQFPEIEVLRVSRIVPDTLLIHVGTALPAFWVSCEESKKTLGDDGKIIEKKITKNVAMTSRGAVLRNVDPATEMFVLFEKEGCPNFSTRIFSENRLREIFAAREALEEVSGQKVVRAGYFRAAREIHLYLENETAIWLDFMRPLQEQIEEYRIAISLVPKLLEPLDHLDARISGKIFYAEKAEE